MFTGKRKCKKCEEIKLLNEFVLRKISIEGRKYICKKCSNENRKYDPKQAKAYREKYAEKAKIYFSEYAIKNKDRLSIYYSEYAAKNSEKKKIYYAKYYVENAEKIKTYHKNHYQENALEMKDKSKRWKRENPELLKLSRKRSYQLLILSPKGRLNHSIKAGIRKSLQGTKNRRHWETLVGYTIEQLKKHLERRFREGMLWENYGTNGWHIDHIIPKSAFNYETPDDIDFKKCWALSNLQPMWARENIKKSDKLEIPFQPSLAIGA
jgi:hypothetical protein